jgi:hypothetical protein
MGEAIMKEKVKKCTGGKKLKALLKKNRNMQSRKRESKIYISKT